MSSQIPSSEGWRRERLHRLTNFGSLDEESPLLALELDTWYYLPFDSIGDMRWRPEYPVVLNMPQASSLQQLLAHTGRAFHGLMSPSSCVMSVGSHPTSIQHYGVGVPVAYIANSEETDAFTHFIAEQNLEGKAVFSVRVRWDTFVTCRDATGQQGNHWIPQCANITLVPEIDNVKVLDSEAPSTSWQATFTCGCASIFRQDNSDILSRTREHWRSIQQANPDVTMFPDDADEYDDLFTTAGPTTAGPTSNHAVSNAELWSVNFPRLEACVREWERLTSGTFHWQL